MTIRKVRCKMLSINSLMPLLKPGYVACDYDDTWWWFPVRPRLSKGSGVWKCHKAIPLSDAFDIIPARDWEKSLRLIGDEE